MVEEKISFSALENIHELTCVSLMGVSFEDIRCQLLSNSHSCKTSNEILPPLLNSSPISNKGRMEAGDIEQVPEILREEDVGSVTLKAIHLQLRRLLKDSNFSEDIVLTAIPEQKSKVMFTFENDVTKLFSPMSLRAAKVKRSASARSEKEVIGNGKRPSFSRHVSHDVGSDTSSLHKQKLVDNPFDAAPKPKLLRQRSITKEQPEELPPQKSRDSKIKDKQSIGYIMFECGLEDISITAVRRLGYKDKTDMTKHPEQFDDLEKNVKDMETDTKVDVEGQGQSSSSHSKGQTSRGHSSSSADQGQTQERTKSGSGKASVYLGSQEMYTSSNSVHSWDSRVSIPSRAGSHHELTPLNGDASSGTLHLKTIWFNFAAPPPLPIKRKADFTK